MASLQAGKDILSVRFVRELFSFVENTKKRARFVNTVLSFKGLSSSVSGAIH